MHGVCVDASEFSLVYINFVVVMHRCVSRLECWSDVALHNLPIPVCWTSEPSHDLVMANVDS